MSVLNTMKALVKENRSLSVVSVPRPKLEREDHIILRVELAGLCRTDLYVAEGKLVGRDRVILGHEFSGTVVESASADIEVGQRVAVNPLISCRVCRHCSGSPAVACQETSFLGLDEDGCFAEFIRVSAGSVHQIDPQLSFLRAAYAEPVAASLAVFKTGIEPTETGAILGKNRFSQLLSNIFAIYGFHNIAIVDENEPIYDEFDFVVETAANDKTFERMFALVRPGGKIILKSRHYEPVVFDRLAAIRKEPVIHIVNYGSFGDALELLGSDLLDIENLTDATYSLSQFDSVFQRAKTSEALKPFFVFE
jgi:threonine dehydrogenase-like Zn-dependent dehydrogenase